MKSKEKGDLGTAKAISHYMGNGYEVLLPIGDKRPYDLVVENDGKLQKVQCKYTTHKSKQGNFCVGLRITGGNQSFHTVKKYEEGDFDLLFAATEEGDYYEIPMKLLPKSELTLGKKFEDYKL
jgi:hypothetical protein